MFTKEAIETLSESKTVDSVKGAVIEAMDSGRAFVFTPEGYTRQDLEGLLPLRRRARGAMATADAAAFASYATAHAEPGATVFVDGDTMTATAVLNLGSFDKPGHCDNTATLKLVKTAAFRALESITGMARGLSQQTVAEFIEDWAPMLSFSNENGDIPLTKALAAIRKMSIETARKVESAEGQLSASRSAFESAAATSADPIPTVIVFRTDAYAGLLARDFGVRLSVLTGGEKPMIGLRLVNVEAHQEAMAKEFAHLVASNLKWSNETVGSLPVIIGSYAKK